MQILIAEDDATSRRVLEKTLRRLGHEVVATGGGREAWKAYRQQYYPVLISDWVMPEGDGLELCRAIRRYLSRQYTVILLLTARGGKTDYLEAMKAGADDFLTKPFDEDQLSARLVVAERMLGLRHQVKQLEGLLPICAYCKRIRDQDATWSQVEDYVALRTEANFSHGICPECTHKFLTNAYSRAEDVSLRGET